MRTLMLLLMLVTLGGTARAVETVEQTPLMRLRRIGNFEVLSGKLQVVHYGKETFRFSSISAAYIGEATFRIAVDFSMSTTNDVSYLVLPLPTVWCQIEEGKTRMYKEPWTSGWIDDNDKKEFANKQISYIDAKVQKAPRDESVVMRQAKGQAKRIALAYLLAWGESNIKDVVFKEDK